MLLRVAQHGSLLSILQPMQLLSRTTAGPTTRLCWRTTYAAHTTTASTTTCTHWLLRKLRLGDLSRVERKRLLHVEFWHLRGRHNQQQQQQLRMPVHRRACTVFALMPAASAAADTTTNVPTDLCRTNDTDRCTDALSDSSANCTHGVPNTTADVTSADHCSNNNTTVPDSTADTRHHRRRTCDRDFDLGARIGRFLVQCIQ
jgi:hypothetical protein